MNMESVCTLDGKCSMIMDHGHNRAFDAQKCQKYKKMYMCPVEYCVVSSHKLVRRKFKSFDKLNNQTRRNKVKNQNYPSHFAQSKNI